MEDHNETEDLRYSRSGRILRKTRKIKEMEEVELEESMWKKFYKQFHTSSLEVNTGHAVNKCDVLKVSCSNSSESSSSLSLNDDSFGYGVENWNQQANNSDSKDSTYFRQEDDYSSTENSENWSISSLSIQESDNSTKYTPKPQDYKFKTNTGRGKRLKNSSSKREITKNSYSAPRKSIGSNKDKCNPRKIYSTRRKVGRNRKGSKFNRKLLLVPIRSLRKSSYAFTEKDKNVQIITGQCSLDRLETGFEFVPTAELNFESDMVKDSKQDVEYPLGIGAIDVAAHLTLLGDHLCKMGRIISQHDEIGKGMYDVLFVSLLCAVGPLLCLTKEIAGLQGMNDEVFVKILGHIPYIMPGFQMK